jgi:hypothetical protein
MWPHRRPRRRRHGKHTRWQADQGACFPLTLIFSTLPAYQPTKLCVQRPRQYAGCGCGCSYSLAAVLAGCSLYTNCIATKCYRRRPVHANTSLHLPFYAVVTDLAGSGESTSVGGVDSSPRLSSTTVQKKRWVVHPSTSSPALHRILSLIAEVKDACMVGCPRILVFAHCQFVLTSIDPSLSVSLSSSVSLSLSPCLFLLPFHSFPAAG